MLIDVDICGKNPSSQDKVALYPATCPVQDKVDSNRNVLSNLYTITV